MQRLSDEITLPCKIIPKYSCIRQMNSSTAITYYGPEEIEKDYVRILFNVDYFDDEYDKRKFTLIHELIHACQRTDELFELNQRWLNNYDLMSQKILKYIESKDQFNAKLAKDDRELVNQLFAWIFEIWDDLFFQENYPNLFDGRMNHLYDFVMRQTDFDSYNDVQIRKESMFVSHIIRAYYLTRISETTPSYTNFKTLCKTWFTKFETRLENKKDEWIVWLNRLTDFSKYPDPTELEHTYSEFSRMLIRN